MWADSTIRSWLISLKSWNDGELHSYLIGITAGIFREADDLGDGELIDRIKDSAKQKEPEGGPA